MASASPTPIGPGSPTATAILTPAPIASDPTAAVAGSVLLILEAQAFPHPNAQSLRLRLAAPADRVRARFYSAAMVYLGELEAGPFAAGWNSLPLTQDLRERLPSGLAYAHLRAFAGERQSPNTAPLRLWTLR